MSGAKGAGAALTADASARAREARLAVVRRVAARVAGEGEAPPMHVAHAAALEGVHRQRLYEWRRDDPEADLLLHQAAAVAAGKRLAEVRDAALGLLDGEHGKANANVLLALLERAHPDEWGPAKQRVAAEVDVTAKAATLSTAEVREQVASWLASDPELVALVVPLLLDEPAARRLIVASLAAVDVLGEGDE
jgi:hypothetical protein